MLILRKYYFRTFITFPSFLLLSYVFLLRVVFIAFLLCFHFHFRCRFVLLLYLFGYDRYYQEGLFAHLGVKNHLFLFSPSPEDIHVVSQCFHSFLMRAISCTIRIVHCVDRVILQSLMDHPMLLVAVVMVIRFHDEYRIQHPVESLFVFWDKFQIVPGDNVRNSTGQVNDL